MREDTADFRQLFLSGAPLLDARAPAEFARGAFPGAVNLPLMDDDERHQVGLCYQEQGQPAAIALGHRLVSGELRAARVAAWASFARAHPDGYLYCFRGGLRSQIVQQWLRDDAGVAYPRVTGGYKAMRSFLIETLDAAAAECNLLVLGGLTGSGKTELITELIAGPGAAVDLEGHARHRGSSFGKRAVAQPAQIDFENGMAIDLLRRRAAGHPALAVEDEGRYIGGRNLPRPFYLAMQAAPLVWLEEPFEARVNRVLEDYVLGLSGEFMAALGEQAGFAAYAGRLREAMAAIAARLGGERYARLADLLEQALARQAESGDTGLHQGWIAVLLSQYYDPMYAYQREQREARIVFRGGRAAVLDYLRERTRA
ncbi:tRNA 2-selenouridine(34) synthase MnmH [Cupriavidus basilensis]|uniref:tRNA 2-selenouridine synthase n=1 Tax=Cupriavidus basilensis TaxID=68895 RepID=A0ABT6B3K0_9BURK|nr:tRNA 2-selenouridine(34) synthase MnmH [Cupriavidus basilensis]MDF3839467.1 tRNA 2-selenouridine(34) synthase MnmH [Cupriavidus basilensis]